MSVLISDDILQSAQISEKELKREVAILLFRQQKLDLDKARELAEMPMAEFQQELANRGIDDLRKLIAADTHKEIENTAINRNKAVAERPLRGLPLQIGADFDEPMSELWDALAE
jgi:predicted HTH domain antitoxin